jgi:hypothetical protein
VNLDVSPGSTPYRKGAHVNGPTQPFIAYPLLSSPLSWGKALNTWNIGFQAPSLAPSADGKKTNQWVATPTWTFTAHFKRVTLSNITVDWYTGKVSPPITHSVSASDPGACVGKPLSLSVHRAHNVR